jgi:hypothetical protein
VVNGNAYVTESVLPGSVVFDPLGQENHARLHPPALPDWDL